SSFQDKNGRRLRGKVLPSEPRPSRNNAGTANKDAPGCRRQNRGCPVWIGPHRASLFRVRDTARSRRVAEGWEARSATSAPRRQGKLAAVAAAPGVAEQADATEAEQGEAARLRNDAHREAADDRPATDRANQRGSPRAEVDRVQARAGGPGQL